MQYINIILLAAIGLAWGCAQEAWKKPFDINASTREAPISSELSPSFMEERPNIIFILVDDLGYSDIGAYGGNIDTPNLDRLAMEGVRFSNGHVYPSCAPTRAGLLTGKDPHWVGLGSQNGVAPPGVSAESFGYRGSLEGEFVGIAQLLADAGYQTFHSGKWHLGAEEGQSPGALGFQRSFNMLHGAASHYQDALGVSPSINPPDGAAVHTLDGDNVDELPGDFYSTVNYTQQLIDMIDSAQSTSDETPFFGYLAYTAVHDPLHAPEELVRKYASRFAPGYESLKHDRIWGLAEQGLIADPSVPVRWLSDTPRWSELSDQQRHDMTTRMAVYAAMLEVVDREIGRLVDYLKETGEFDDTLLVIASDNGAATLPKTFYAQNREEVRWQQMAYPLNAVADYGQPGSFTSLGAYNAQAVSGPYFGFKANPHEGGTRVPMIVRTPGAAQARIVRDFVHIVDFYPTFAEIAGVDFSEQRNLAGCSLVELIESEDGRRCNDDFGLEYMGWRAYRDGDWKLVFVSERFGGTGRYALYDLSTDPGETQDLSAQNPRKLADLSRKWVTYAEENNVTIVPMSSVNNQFNGIADRILGIDWGAEADDNRRLPIPPDTSE